MAWPWSRDAGLKLCQGAWQEMAALDGYPDCRHCGTVKRELSRALSVHNAIPLRIPFDTSSELTVLRLPISR